MPLTKITHSYIHYFKTHPANPFLPFSGIKVIGGVKEVTGEEFGVYVKRILPGGLASTDGTLLLLLFICICVVCRMKSVESNMPCSGHFCTLCLALSDFVS